MTENKRDQIAEVTEFVIALEMYIERVFNIPERTPNQCIELKERRDQVISLLYDAMMKAER